MLEHETELIKQTILESTIRDRNSIRLNEVMAASLPRGVKSFIASEVAKGLESDLKQSSRMTKSTAPTYSVRRPVLHALAMEYVLERNEYVKLVEDAVHFLENYLCRPQWTLNQLLFENEQEITFDMLVRKFEYVIDYAYFGTLLQRYARQKSWSEIRRDQIKECIERIDDEVMRQHTPKQMALITQSIFDFLLFGNISVSHSIPVGAILLFFEDKNLSAVKDYVERICHVRSQSQVSMGELIGIIEDLYDIESTVGKDVKSSESIAPQQQSTQHEITDEKIVESAVSEHQASPPPEMDQPEAMPVSGQGQIPSIQNTVSEPVNLHTPDVLEVQQTSETELKQAGDATPDTSPPRSKLRVTNPGALIAYAAEREAQRHALFLTFPDPPAQKVQSSLPDIEQLLSDYQQEKFARIIFTNNEQHFRQFLASVNKAQTWSEAQLLLRELFEMKKLDILSPDVIEFTDVMNARYHTELKPAE